MGWLRLVGSLKLQVSFAEYHLFYRALLQKRPIKKAHTRSFLREYVGWYICPCTTKETHVFTKETYTLPKEDHILTKEKHVFTTETHAFAKETHVFTEETHTFTKEDHIWTKEKHVFSKETHVFTKETHIFSTWDRGSIYPCILMCSDTSILNTWDPMCGGHLYQNTYILKEYMYQNMRIHMYLYSQQMYSHVLIHVSSTPTHGIDDQSEYKGIRIQE